MNNYEKLVYNYYEYEYKIKKLKEIGYPNVDKWEAELEKVCDELIEIIKEIVEQHLEELLTMDFGEISEVRIDKSLLGEMNKANSLGDKIAVVSEGLNWYHAGYSAAEILEVDSSLLDDLTDGKYIKQWDRELRKMGNKKNIIAENGGSSGGGGLTPSTKKTDFRTDFEPKSNYRTKWTKTKFKMRSFNQIKAGEKEIPVAEAIGDNNAFIKVKYLVNDEKFEFNFQRETGYGGVGWEWDVQKAQRRFQDMMEEMHIKNIVQPFTVPDILKEKEEPKSKLILPGKGWMWYDINKARQQASKKLSSYYEMKKLAWGHGRFITTMMIHPDGRIIRCGTHHSRYLNSDYVSYSLIEKRIAKISKITGIPEKDIKESGSDWDDLLMDNNWVKVIFWSREIGICCRSIIGFDDLQKVWDIVSVEYAEEEDVEIHYGVEAIINTTVEKLDEFGVAKIFGVESDDYEPEPEQLPTEQLPTEQLPTEQLQIDFPKTAENRRLFNLLAKYFRWFASKRVADSPFGGTFFIHPDGRVIECKYFDGSPGEHTSYFNKYLKHHPDELKEVAKLVGLSEEEVLKKGGEMDEYLVDQGWAKVINWSEGGGELAIWMKRITRGIANIWQNILRLGIDTGKEIISFSNENQQYVKATPREVKEFGPYDVYYFKLEQLLHPFRGDGMGSKKAFTEKDIQTPYQKGGDELDEAGDETVEGDPQTKGYVEMPKKKQKKFDVDAVRSYNKIKADIRGDLK